MVTDKRIIAAINGVKNKKLRETLLGNGEHKGYFSAKDFNENIVAFRKLLPEYFKEFILDCPNIVGTKEANCIYGCKRLYGYLCLEKGVVDLCDIRSVKNFGGAGIAVNELERYAPSSLNFQKGLKAGKFTVADVIALADAEPEYLPYLLPLMTASDNEDFYTALNGYLQTAKMQDTLRYEVLCAMLTAHDAAALVRYTDEIDKNNYYRLRVINDVAARLGDYTVILPPKELVAVLRDAAKGETEKYFAADFRHAYHFINTFDRVHEKEFFAFAVRLLREGGARARQALLYSLSEKSVNGEYAAAIFSSGISLEDLSFFHNKLLLSDDMRKEDMPPVFEELYNVLLSMDKVNYHYNTDDDISFARDVGKSSVVRPLAVMASRLSDKSYTKRLDKLYDTLREEAQATYLEYNGKKTSLDKHACAVAFLKTDNYRALRYYDEQKTVLTYADAVIVSDYLKSKKQNVKSKIIKEFLRSPDKPKITEYLLGAKEDYKKAAGEEMKDSDGKVSKSKLDKPTQQFFWNSESVFEVHKPVDGINALAAVKFDIKPIKPLSFARYKDFIDKLEKFIKDNADYEYDTNYGEGMATLGSRFTTLKRDEAVPHVGFKHYPLGAELKNLYKDTLTESELAGLSLLTHCAYNDNAELFFELSGKSKDAKKIYEHFDKYDKRWWSCSSTYAVVKELDVPVIFELLSERTLCGILYMLTGAECLKKPNRNNKDFYSHIAYEYIRALSDSEDKETVQILLTVECAFVAAGVVKYLSYDVLKRAYEYGYISNDFARYFMLEHGGFAHVYDVKSGKDCLLRKDYGFPKFKKALTEFLADALNAEFKRGNLQTPYSEVIRCTPTFGIDNYMRAIVALRKLTWVRSPYGCEKNEIFSKILKGNRAAESDNCELFAELATKYGLTHDELIRAALFNPVYVDYTAKYLGINNLKLAVYWFVAHLNETLYGDEKDEREEKIKEFSDISYPDFQDGAFDCKWYEEMVSTVPAAELKRIYDNAKYVTVGGLHKRAQRFFDAVNGKISAAECLEKINGTRNKDYCLIYSLIPVKEKAELKERYEVLSEFLRTSKQFGAQRQASERRTVEIAFENLARVAGYSDTNIFIFEMEADEPSNIYAPLTTDGVTVVPYIDERAFKVAYGVSKEGKTLSAIPQKAAKNKEISELREQIKSLNKKFRRIISSFEQCMITRAAFSAEQLGSMCREPIVKTVLGKLLLLSSGKLCVYSNGKLTDTGGKEISTGEEILVAHPIELRAKGLLPAAVEYVVKNNIKQPFKQILREIYPVSEQETGQDEVLRFKGYNVDIKKCVAALKGRGWSVSEDVGLRKVYYKTDTVAAIFRKCDFLYSADYGNVNRELHGIFFLRRKSGEILPLKDVDDVTFSETLRDVDLMVSVSSNTVYDFELAMSSVEIRQEILKSFVAILGLTNVGFLKDNIKVSGHYGTYIINIRTGLVFKEGKGNLMIDTVYSVDKPLLLDFADEDPMTADVISKAIILANDKAVRDPAILREIKN